jgi:hypothetical protein
LTQSLGTSYAVTIPTLSDQASILDAFKYYHQGGLSGSPTSNSVEQHLININTRATALETAIGWPYSNGSSISARLTSLESTVGGSLSATYLKAIPSSNDTAATRNLVSPSTTSVIPLQVQGLVGQAANLQEWKTSAATVAYVTPTGRLFSHDGSSTAEVVTLSGTQTLTNKTLQNPIQTIGTNARVSSYTLVLTDQSKIIEVNNAASTTITIPADATVAFPVGSYIMVAQTGAGQVTIAGAGFTPSATPGLKTRTQWSVATLIKRGTDSWIVAGDLVA